MTKEQLMEMGLTEEQAEKVLVIYKEDLKSFIPKARFDEVNEAKKNLEEQLKDRDKQLKDHIHMLVSIPPKISVSSFMGYLKGKSSLMIFNRHANLKYKYGNRHFWCRGYYVDTVGRNRKAIEQYIRRQLQEDIASDQISLNEYIDPFTVSE
uniref:Putative transposase n=1 Tax=Acetivibrio thermocellus TaxID=1515 RepID=Q9AL37_ACETH|nr:putative transposase [Acetivibrio thermocellus]